MKVIAKDSPEDWAVGVSCPRCATKFEIEWTDLEEDGFKVSGYFFAGTAVCVDKIFTKCPGCYHYTHFLEETLPWVVVDAMRKRYNVRGLRD